jgi:type II secretory ATPase GspE/PulE/Tfp pilus assembly ATPase PilB-like protein
MTVPAMIKQEVVSRLKVLAQLDITEKRNAQDGHVSLNYGGNEFDLRVSVMPTVDGEKTVIRVLDKNRMATDLQMLGIDAQDMTLVERAIGRPYGMFLVTGPTGSGKTTTLYALLRSIDAIEKNIITIENPVEYKLNRINQIQIDASGNQTFANSLRTILRQDPDVIMIGEIRDLETAEIAVQAALTGHLVLSTLHTNDAVTAITRLRELGIPPFLISSCVVMVVAQRLVRKICPDCRQSYEPDEETLELLGIDRQAVGEFARGKGCRYCFDSGFSGREGVYEILNVGNEMQNAIAQGKNTLELKEMAVEKGMKTLLDAALMKVSDGKSTVEEVKRVIAPERF